MASRSESQHFVLLPTRGVSLGLPAAGRGRIEASTTTARVDKPGKRRHDVPAIDLTVLDSIRDDGPKLVALTPQAATQLRVYEPDVMLAPLLYYTPATAPWPSPIVRPALSGVQLAPGMVLRVVSARDGLPISSATVVAFTDWGRRAGVQELTDAHGSVILPSAMIGTRCERLYVLLRDGFWSILYKDVLLTTGHEIRLQPIDLAFVDGLRHTYGHAPDDAGHDVRVGVIDTGIAPHPDLLIEGGENTVTGEDPRDYGDAGDGHGTHVAGIIAARGIPPHGLRGLAPAAALRSYRPFGQGSGQASNFAIAKAIDRAVTDGCDLINLSLAGRSTDIVIAQAIIDACDAGCLLIAAAGNDDRAPVSFPAADLLTVGVAAMGRVGTFPHDAPAQDAVAAPFGTDANDFVAAFSNVGPEITFIGPGVAILSTAPGGYAAKDGTSMACPAVTGATARLLAQRDDVRMMPRDKARSDAMKDMVRQAAGPLGFGPQFEGHGRIA